MADLEYRLAQRRSQASGDKLDELQHRVKLKRACGSAGLDLCLPHSVHIVGAQRHPYGESLAQLMRDDDGSGLQPFYNGRARPFTFAENLRARLEDDNSPLWNLPLNSCTGVLYKASPEGGVVEFKIVQISEDLLGLPEDFNSVYVPLNFYAIETEETFRTDSVVCNRVLDLSMARNHRAWLAAAGYDQNLLNDYVERAEAKARERGIDELSREYCTVFLTVNKPKTDQLRSLVLDFGDYSGADGYGHLSSSGRFARIDPQ